MAFSLCNRILRDSIDASGKSHIERDVAGESILFLSKTRARRGAALQWRTEVGRADSRERCRRWGGTAAGSPPDTIAHRVLPGDFCESLRFWLWVGPDDDKAKPREWGNPSPVSGRSAGIGPGFGVLAGGLRDEAQAPCGQGESQWLLPAHGAPGQPERRGGRGALPTQVGLRSRRARVSAARSRGHADRSARPEAPCPESSSCRWRSSRHRAGHPSLKATCHVPAAGLLLRGPGPLLAPALVTGHQQHPQGVNSSTGLSGVRRSTRRSAKSGVGVGARPPPHALCDCHHGQGRGHTADGSDLCPRRRSGQRARHIPEDCRCLGSCSGFAVNRISQRDHVLFPSRGLRCKFCNRRDSWGRSGADWGDPPSPSAPASAPRAASSAPGAGGVTVLALWITGDQHSCCSKGPAWHQVEAGTLPPPPSLQASALPAKALLCPMEVCLPA